jgi:DNA-binding transcriptional MerR regulator
MAERAHLSIGEVLSLLREEFPDVTISKIRFLESQGLLDPERTPSGYRKFYDEDVERLRWILRQQRENFLPLKVIKGRLVDQPDAGPPGLAFDGDAGVGVVTAPTPAGSGLAAKSVPNSAPNTAADRGANSAPHTAANSSPGRTSGGPTLAAAYNQSPGRATNQPPGPAPTEAIPGPSPASHQPPAADAFSPPMRPSLATGPSGGNYTLDELAEATGLSEQAIVELSGFGLVGSRDVGGTVYYDEDAATIAALAAGFARHGVEARHLRMYKNAAERESALFEQIVMPLVKQRNPQARQQAATALEDLGRLSSELRRALLRQALGRAF